MPRIVLVVPSFPKLSETFIVSKFLGLLDSGWDAHVVCRTSAPDAWSHFAELQRRGVRERVHRTWPTQPKGKAAMLWPAAVGSTLARNLRSTTRYVQQGRHTLGGAVWKHLYLDAPIIQLQPELVHFEFGTLAVGRMYIKQLLGCKVSVSFRGYDLNYVGLDQPEYYADVWRNADGIHVLGNDLWQRARHRGCPPELYHARIPPAIDTEYFRPVQSKNDAFSGGKRPFRILSVGRLTWVKGYEYALQAVAQLRDLGIDCSYTIIGDGEYLEAIAFARHQLELDNIVRLTGGLPREEVQQRLNAADVFLHAAVSEGYCNAVLEAQSMELPCVVSDAGGLVESVFHGTTGFVVERRNPGALAESLATLAKNPVLRREMGHAGRERVREHFQLGDQVEAFDQFYRTLLHDT